jgi:hypothetical protein
VHWAESALGPDAQCAWPTPWRRLGPRAPRVRGPRPRGPRPRPAARDARRGGAARRRRWLDAGARRRRGGDGSPARRRWRGVTGDGRAREAAAAATAWPGQRARGHGRSGWRWHSRGGCRGGGATRLGGGRAARGDGRRGARARCGRERRCRDTRRGVPTAALSRCVGVVRGGHAAAARCRAGPARCAATDKWGPLVNDFRIKIHSEGN